MRRVARRLRGLIILGLATAAVLVPASRAPAAQVFAQYDALTTHIYVFEAPPDEERAVRRPAHVRIRISELSRELTDRESRDVQAEVPDPLNRLCPAAARDTPDGTEVEVSQCPVTEMEEALERRISQFLVQIPSLEFDEVFAHIALRRDGDTKRQMLAPATLGSALLALGLLLLQLATRNRSRGGERRA